MGLTVNTDYLPEKGGRMYSLNNGNALDELGDNNWLSDSVNSAPTFNVDIEKIKENK